MNEAVEAGQESGQEENTIGNEEDGKVTGMPDNYQSIIKNSQDQQSTQESSTRNQAIVEEKQEEKQEEKNQLQEGQWMLKDGVLGSGDRPPWLLEKYGYNMEAQAKAMPDAQRRIGEQNQRLGAFSGAPDKYDFSTLEDENFVFDTQDKVFNQFVTECQNNNVSQDFALKVASFAKEMIQQPAVNSEEEIKAYGPAFENDKKNIMHWVENNVAPSDATELFESIQTAGAVRALNALMNNTKSFSIPAGGEANTAPVETLKDLQRDFAENLYGGENIAKNPDKLEKWVERFKKKSS